MAAVPDLSLIHISEPTRLLSILGGGRLAGPDGPDGLIGHHKVRHLRGLQPTMFVVVAIVQALSGLGLIFLVLLHSGKGGGLSDMFGGGIGAQTAGSTVVEQNLDRITVLTALVFAFTTITLGLLF